jgi:hypothetical protein
VLSSHGSIQKSKATQRFFKELARRWIFFMAKQLGFENVPLLEKLWPFFQINIWGNFFPKRVAKTNSMENHDQTILGKPLTMGNYL